MGERMRPLLLALAGAVALGVFAGAAPMADVLGWATLVLGGTWLVVYSRRWPHLRGAVLAGLAVRLFLAVIQVYVTPLPSSGEDDLFMEQRGWEYSQLSFEDRMAVFETGSRLYSWCIGVLYALTDRSALMIIGINVVLGALVVLMAGRIAQQLWGERPARAAAWATAFFPTLMLLSAVGLREVAVTAPFTGAVLLLVRWQGTQRVGTLAAALLLLLLSSGFHSVVVFTFVGVMFLMVQHALAAAARGRGRALARVSVALALAVMVGIGVAQSGWGLDKFGSVEGINEERLAEAQETVAGSRSSYLTNLRIDGPVDALVQLPLRLVFFVLAPFPWMIRTPTDLFGLVDSSLYLVLVVLGVRALRRGSPGRAVRPLVVMVGIVLAVFATGVSNYGTAIRHRAKVAPLLIALAAGGTGAALRERRRLLEGAAAPAEPVPAGEPVPLHAGAAG
jgi:hypothetical protein